MSNEGLTREFSIRNMVSRSCIRLVIQHLKELEGVTVLQVSLGRARLRMDADLSHAGLDAHLQKMGF